MTMVIGIYDSNKKELLLSNAGHEPPLIFQKENLFEFRGSRPAIRYCPKFKFTEKLIPFNESSMYIFTDGITEMKDAKGDAWTRRFSKLHKKISKHCKQSEIKKIIEDLIKSGRIQKDDLTIVAMTVSNMLGIPKAMIFFYCIE